MPLEKPERPLKTLVLGNNDEFTREIPRDNAVRRIILTFIINLTNTATPPTFIEDDILNYIKSITLFRNDREIKWNLPARMAYYLEKIEKGTSPYKVAPITTASATYDAIVTLMIDFAQNRLNENDLSALLQTGRLSSLDLVITTGDVADIASANAPTINSSKVEIEIKEVAGTVTVDKQEIDIQDIPVLDIVEDTSLIALEANHTSFDRDTQEIEVRPTPSNILTTALMVTDNGLKSNDLVTELKYQKVKGQKKDIYHRTFKSQWRGNKTEYQQETLDTGFVLIDWQEKFGRLGFENRGQKGENLLRLLTDATVVPADDNIEIYTRSV